MFPKNLRNRKTFLERADAAPSGAYMNKGKCLTIVATLQWKNSRTRANSYINP